MDNKYLYLGILMFIIPSCTVRKQKVSHGDSNKGSLFDYDDRLLMKKHLTQKQLSMPLVKFDQRLVDIPIPLDTICLQDCAGDDGGSSPNTFQLIYKSLLKRDFLIDFFNQQMEVFGWDKEGEVLGSEVVLIFTKLYKKAIVSIRPCVKSSSSMIIISLYTVLNKQGDENNDRFVC